MSHHTTKAAVFKVTGVLPLVESNGSFIVFILLDPSEAFRANEFLLKTLSFSLVKHSFLIFFLLHSLPLSSDLYWIILHY
jgi:hypothetical protein